MDNDKLVAKIFLRSALPLIKVIADEKPLYKKLFAKKGILQFSAKGSDMGAYVEFSAEGLDVKYGVADKPNLNLVFKSLHDMNAFFAGKPAIPVPKGIFSLHLLFRILPMLLDLKMLMPQSKPSDPKKKALKVKLVLYMITNALSQLNKAGDEKIRKLTENSPDRIFQWTVKDGPAAYLRIKNGKSKSGRGTYTRRRPFVHMMFPDINGAMKVLTSEVPLVEAVKLGYVATEGAMEYSKEIGLHMQRIEEFTTNF